MKSLKKVTIIGGAGRVAFTLVVNFLRYSSKEIDNLDICLYDKDEKNLVMSKQAIDNLMELTKKKLHVSITTNAKEALENSDIVLYGVNGERGTSPPFNISKYFGNIEILCNFLKEYQKYLRNKWLLIFSNPVDLLCMSAQKKFPALKIAGICTGSEEFKQNICRLLKVKYGDIDLEYIGTNHHGFVQKLYVKEKDVLPDLSKILKKYKPKSFEGFRKGDEYDLYTTLDLFNSSGELTIPLGHDPYWHGNDDFNESAKKARWRPNKKDFNKIINQKKFRKNEKTLWNLMDSWGASAITSTVLNMLGNKSSYINLQLPNKGIIPELPNHIFVEGPVSISKRGFTRRKAKIPWDIRLHLAHSAMYLDRLAEAIVTKDATKMIRALLFKGQKRNYKYSLPAIRQFLNLHWSECRIAEDLFSQKMKNEMKSILEDERLINFMLM